MRVYGVKFKSNQGYWSKPYSYLFDGELTKDEIVLVPTSGFFSVGKVTEEFENFVPDPKVVYKTIICTITHLVV